MLVIDAEVVATPTCVPITAPAPLMMITSCVGSEIEMLDAAVLPVPVLSVKPLPGSVVSVIEMGLPLASTRVPGPTIVLPSASLIVSAIAPTPFAA